MKLNKIELIALEKCVNDLSDYYATCGNNSDFKNLAFLKKNISVQKKT